MLVEIMWAGGGNGTVREPRTHRLARRHALISYRRVEIEFLGLGVKAFSFTFGGSMQVANQLMNEHGAFPTRSSKNGLILAKRELCSVSAVTESELFQWTEGFQLANSDRLTRTVGDLPHLSTALSNSQEDLWQR